MPHDPTKVLMGMSLSSEKDVTVESADPATFVAGLAVRRSDDGGVQLDDDSTATLIGISAGASLGDISKIAVFRSGLRIPVKLKDEYTQASAVIGDLTFTAVPLGVLGNQITVTLADTEESGGAEVTVDGYDITVGIESTVTTATAIANAIEGNEEASALVTVEIADGEGSTAQTAAAETPLEGGDEGVDHVVPGGPLKIDDTEGTASSDGDATNGLYCSGVLTGVYSDGTTARVALVDIPGGL